MREQPIANNRLPEELREVGNWIAAGLDHAKHADWTGKVPAAGEFCGDCWPWDIRTKRDFTVAWQILWTLGGHNFEDVLKLTKKQKRALNYFVLRLHMFQRRGPRRTPAAPDGPGELLDLDRWRRGGYPRGGPVA